MKALEDTFLHRKPAEMLVAIHRGDADYASVLSREVDCTYSHTVKVLDTFKEHGLVRFEKTGRKKLISLTDAGERLADHLDDLLTTMDGLNGTTQ